METLIILIMLLVVLCFVLKLTFMNPWLQALEALFVGLAVWLSSDLAAGQSKTQIEGWLGDPALMLDMAVLMTVDVAVLIAFCISMVASQPGVRARIIRGFLLYMPGLLIVPVMFYALVRLLFSMTGVDFDVIGMELALSFFIGAPLLSTGLRWLLPEQSLRLELLFFLACIIALQGIIATVNGRTASVGVSEINLPAMAGVSGLVLVGALGGYLLYNRKSYKQS